MIDMIFVGESFDFSGKYSLADHSLKSVELTTGREVKIDGQWYDENLDEVTPTEEEKDVTKYLFFNYITPYVHVLQAYDKTKQLHRMVGILTTEEDKGKTIVRVAIYNELMKKLYETTVEIGRDLGSLHYSKFLKVYAKGVQEYIDGLEYTFYD